MTGPRARVVGVGCGRDWSSVGAGPEAGALTPKPAGISSDSGSGLKPASGAFPVSIKTMFGFSWDRQDCFVCWECSGNVCRFSLIFSRSISALTSAP